MSADQLKLPWAPKELRAYPHDKDRCKTRRHVAAAMLRAKLDAGFVMAELEHISRYVYCEECKPQPKVDVRRWRERDRDELVRLERSRVVEDVPRGTTRPRRSRRS